MHYMNLVCCSFRETKIGKEEVTRREQNESRISLGSFYFGGGFGRHVRDATRREERLP